MLRAIANGYRDFKETPDTFCVRYNWIFVCVFEGSLYPEFDPPLPVQVDPMKVNFWIIPPQTRYVVVARTRRVDRAVLHFSDVPEILRATCRERGYLAKRLSQRKINEARTVVASIEQDFRTPTSLSEVRYEVAMLKLMLLGLDHLDAKPLHPLYNLARERVEKALAWYNEHMASSPSLSDVAGNVHVSQTHLRRHFYEQLGRSPKAVFSKLRMEKAAKLLVGSMLTLDQIAEQCGFNSASDFCRAFKGYFHVTPNSWRHNVNSAQSRSPR